MAPGDSVLDTLGHGAVHVLFAPVSAAIAVTATFELLDRERDAA